MVRDGKRGGDGQARSCPTARGPCAGRRLALHWHTAFRHSALAGGCWAATNLGSNSMITFRCGPYTPVSVQVLDNWANFRRYSLPTPVGLLRADAHRPPFRDNLCEVQPHFPGLCCDDIIAAAAALLCLCGATLQEVQRYRVLDTTL